MPNAIDSTGLQIQNQSEIVSEILNGTSGYPGMYSIYGSNINVAPNSPDGQMVNIIAQAKLDVLELIRQVYTSFDPDQAVGTALDQRCAINGVVRNAGTYTTTGVIVVTDRALTLPGLDTSPDSAFTISDSSGNRFSLVNSYVFASADTQTLTFRAVNLGPVVVLPNTLTVINTVTLGVLRVNNPTAPLTTGLAEETDSSLRIRRANSVALPSRGYLSGLYGALIDATGVTSALVLENITNTTDANGIPGHSIWCVVQGGTAEQIAELIYLKRNAGCGMKGSVSQAVTQPDGGTIDILFDRPTSEDLYISFNLTAITGTFDPVFIRNRILAETFYNIGQSADASAITQLVKELVPNCAVTDMGVSSDGSTYMGLLAPTGVNYQFGITSSRVIINGTPG